MNHFIKQVDVKELGENEKNFPKEDECCKCRLRKRSSHIEEFEQHLKSVTYSSEKRSSTDISNIKQKLGANQPQHSFKGMNDSTDFIGNFLGPIGKWQLRTIFLIYLVKIPSSWFMSCVSINDSNFRFQLLIRMLTISDYLHSSK